MKRVFPTPSRRNFHTKKINNIFFKNLLQFLKPCVIISTFRVSGPLVKRLRHQPLTLKTWVRFPYGSPKNTGTASAVPVFFLWCPVRSSNPALTAVNISFCISVSTRWVRIRTAAVGELARQRQGARIQPQASSRTGHAYNRLGARRKIHTAQRREQAPALRGISDRRGRRPYKVRRAR